MNLFKAKEFEGIAKNSEIGFLICAKPDGSIDFKDLNPEISSESTFFVNMESFKKWCPDSEGFIIFGHTHGIGLSENSKEDRFSMMDIFAAKQGDTLCAAGIDGVSCHIATTKPPLVFRVRWNDDFYTDLARLGKRTPVYANSVFCEAQKPSWFNRIFRKMEHKYECNYRFWQDGFDDTYFGKFDEVLFLNADSHDSLYANGTYKMAYGNLECLNFEPVLICRENKSGT